MTKQETNEGGPINPELDCQTRNAQALQPLMDEELKTWHGTDQTPSDRYDNMGRINTLFNVAAVLCLNVSLVVSGPQRQEPEEQIAAGEGPLVKLLKKMTKVGLASHLETEEAQILALLADRSQLEGLQSTTVAISSLPREGETRLFFTFWRNGVCFSLPSGQGEPSSSHIFADWIKDVILLPNKP